MLRIFDPTSSPASPEIVFTHTLDVAADTDTIALGISGSTLFGATTTGHILFLDLANGSLSTASVPGPISVLAATADLTTLATGGNQKEVEIYTRAADAAWTSVWKARNVKPNHLKLEIPVHPSQIEFLPSVEGSWRMVVSTLHGYLRVYDTAVSRRPVFSAEPSKGTGLQTLRIHPGSTIPAAQEPLIATKGMEADKAHLTKDLRVVLSNSAETFCVYSLHERREVGLFKGLSGAVNGSAVDAKNGLVAGVGFGRYLGIYDARSRLLKSRVYVKTQGLCVAVLDGEDEVVDEPEPEKEADVWDEMDEVKAAEEERMVQVRVKRKKDGARDAEGKRPKVSEE